MPLQVDIARDDAIRMHLKCDLVDQGIFRIFPGTYQHAVHAPGINGSYPYERSKHAKSLQRLAHQSRFTPVGKDTHQVGKLRCAQPQLDIAHVGRNHEKTGVLIERFPLVQVIDEHIRVDQHSCKRHYCSPLPRRCSALSSERVMPSKREVHGLEMLSTIQAARSHAAFAGRWLSGARNAAFCPLTNRSYMRLIAWEAFMPSLLRTSLPRSFSGRPCALLPSTSP